MNRLIGYARVSTKEQHLDLQMDALRKTGCETIYSDKVSGARSDRPGLQKLLQEAKKGDIVVVWRLDRLGRSLIDLVTIVNKFGESGIDFKSLSENIDTTNAVGKLTFHIFAALAEYIRGLIRENVKAGVQAARKNRDNWGRRPTVTREMAETARKLLDSGNSPEFVWKSLGVSKATLYRHIKQDKS